ncbi:testis-expressed protein 10 homolog [Plodia interpunctella]|uniref:testis-expressed protein 10 homolog n=1 Tax=Plodia interpunctella TaxID=58824 RepID=UPI002368E9E5|nr:testis-expressed protein 10 homolog [Plodia interpunctella]
MPKTGATRHQKFLKSERSKIKLKSKKDLPKGTNVTKTNFKVKKIIIKEQLKKHGLSEALSTRKLNIKELLSRLNHFNTNSRTDALDGLKELVTAHPEVLDQNLGQLILGVTPLVLNIEKVVRHESLKVLHTILSNINMEKIEPFFDIMSTYLRSAMTHIDNRIQEDSLLFLDLLLQCTSQKVAEDFHKILPNFLDMISKLRVDSKPGRTLTVNLGSQITSVKWRVKVLHRLKDYLQKFIDHNEIGNKVTQIDTIKTFDESKHNIFSLFKPNYTSVCYISSFSAKHSQDVLIVDEAEKFKEYIDTLIPLLFETWLEVCPKANSEKNIETVISEDAASLLKHTLNVFSLIFKLVLYQNKKNPSSKFENYFIQKYKSQFNQSFMEAFPYVTNLRSKQKKVNNLPFEDEVIDPKLVAQNLEISYLFIVLNPNIHLKNQNSEICATLNYIEKTFCQRSNDSVQNYVIMILETIFTQDNGWTKNSSILEVMFCKLIETYFNQNISNNFKQKIFTLLCKIALNEKLSHFHSCNSFETWLKNLPDILLDESITVQTIDIIHLFSIRNNKIFNAVIKSNLVKVIENLPSIKVSDYNSDTTSYHKLFSILYWIRCWDDVSLTLLEKQLLDNKYKSDYGKYIFDTLRLRTGGIL